MKMKQKHKKRWTFSGIKRFYPALSFEEWLTLVRRGQ
jgi:hypothetical protein